MSGCLGGANAIRPCVFLCLLASSCVFLRLACVFLRLACVCAAYVFWACPLTCAEERACQGRAIRDSEFSSVLHLPVGEVWTAPIVASLLSLTQRGACYDLVNSIFVNGRI